MIRKYGKSNSFLAAIKDHSLIEHNRLVKKQRQLANLYNAQERRESCINCGLTLHYYSNCDFVKLGGGYTFCNNCGHLNGMHKETDEFYGSMYTDESGSRYAKEYVEKDKDDFNSRVKQIYIPKAQFLGNSLVANGVDPNKLSYLDFGCGSGYFVSAMRKISLTNILGADVSKIQVDYGNKMIEESYLSLYDTKETGNVLKKAESDVVIMLGVLEHLQYPREALWGLKKNPNVKYVFLTLPLFSLSVYLEMLSPDMYHRQLSGGHTHLYTEDSIKYFCKEFGFEIVSEWWFGMDIFDLYRNVLTRVKKDDGSNKIVNKWQQKMETLMDSLQLEIDKSHFCSEVEILLRKI